MENRNFDLRADEVYESFQSPEKLKELLGYLLDGDTLRDIIEASVEYVKEDQDLHWRGPKTREAEIQKEEDERMTELLSQVIGILDERDRRDAESLLADPPPLYSEEDIARAVEKEGDDGAERSYR